MKTRKGYYNISLIILFIAFLTFFISCQEEPAETPTKGYLLAYCDNSLFPISEKLGKEFMRLYPKSKIDIKPLKLKEGIVKIINDETRLFISTRNFNKEELEIIKNNHLEIRTYKFVYDGIAVICNKKNTKDSIMLDEITEMLTDKKYLNKIVMPYKNSGIYDYIKDEILFGKEPISVEFVDDEKDVIKMINKYPEKMGLVGINLINDSSDVKILSIGKINPVSLTYEFYNPHPAYLYQQVYPFTRLNYIFLREPYVGIASGFTTFLTFTDGQKIALENNLAPAAVPVKLKRTY